MPLKVMKIFRILRKTFCEYGNLWIFFELGITQSFDQKIMGVMLFELNINLKARNIHFQLPFSSFQIGRNFLFTHSILLSLAEQVDFGEKKANNRFRVNNSTFVSTQLSHSNFLSGERKMYLKFNQLKKTSMTVDKRNVDTMIFVDNKNGASLKKVHGMNLV
jgi:hypothetical protein